MPSVKDDIEAYTIGGGSGVTTTGTKEVSFMDYQTVTSHGNEAVPGAVHPTIIGHHPGKAVVTRVGSNKDGYIHVPIHNPPAAVDTIAYLRDILVNFSTENGAIVESVTLYYDSAEIVSVDARRAKTFYVQFNVNEAREYAYKRPSGISVAFHLKFPNSDSTVNLHSVTLVYQATSSSAMPHK